MTDEEMIAFNGQRIAVVDIANDYQYDGWVTSVFTKRSGQWRCIVEDENGRLFVHNSGQLIRRVNLQYEYNPDGSIKGARVAPQPTERYRHKKRGSTYTIIARACLQQSSEFGPVEGDQMVIYREESGGTVHARSVSEFFDGRFEGITIGAPAHSSVGPVDVRELVESLPDDPLKMVPSLTKLMADGEQYAEEVREFVDKLDERKRG